ncbi:MAG TPA: hypothetical protein VN643_02800 [Pyrinomonadaceae bacterium]|nr:hypothetical protein [Pyrinomonadaceae bacterium]
MNLKTLKLALGLILVLGILYLAVEGKPRKMQNIPAGIWGGQHVKIDVDGVSATIEYDCAHGTINGPLKLDNKGNFSLTGTHATEGGPTRLNPEKGRAAIFTGWTDGKTMKLTVRYKDSKDDIGTFELERGNQGRLRKCR